MIYRLLLLLPLLFIKNAVTAQSLLRQNGDSSVVIDSRLVSSYVNDVSSKAGQIDQKLDKYTERALNKVQKQEERIRRKLEKTDSLKAAKLFANTGQQYKRLQNRLEKPTSLKHYIPSLDTISTSIKFLQQNEKLIAATKEGQTKLKEAMTKIKGMEGQFQKAEEVKKFLKERKQYLKEQLQNRGFAKELKKLNKQTFYYGEQLNEYKSLLKDHKKAERKMIALLSKTKLFNDFIRKNSYLASFFRLPADPNSPASLVNTHVYQPFKNSIPKSR